MKTYRFIEGSPQDGQMVLGVVYHAVRERQIAQLLEFATRNPELYELEMHVRVPPRVAPIGYVGEGA